MTTLSYLYRLSACASLCATFLLQGVSLSQAGEGQPKLHCLAIGIQGDLETQAKHPDRIDFPKARFARQDATKFIDALQKTTATEFRYVSLNSDELTQEQVRENYQLALEAFGALKIDRCMSLLEGILKTKSDHTDAIRLRARCLTLSGRAVEAIDELKRLSLKLTAKVFTADASLLGVRDPQNTSKILLPFRTGDELEISDYSPEGKNSRGQTIPRGKYLYVTRMKKEGTEEWLDAKGVIFADAITPTSRDQVVRQTQSSQQPFGSATIRTNSIDRVIPKSHYRSLELDAQQKELQRVKSILLNQT